MRKLFGSALLVCALSASVLADGGGTHEGGNDGPPPCPTGVECPSGGSTNAAETEDASVFVVWINGLPFAFTY